MKTNIYFKITIACLGLFSSLGVASAQTVEAKPSTVQAWETSDENYKMMGLIELARRAGKGDKKAAVVLEKRLNPERTISKSSDPAGPVIGSGKGLGVVAKKYRNEDNYFRRRMKEIPQELDKQQARLLEIKALMLAGKGTAETKAEIAQILKKVTMLNEEMKFISAMRTVEAIRGGEKATAKILKPPPANPEKSAAARFRNMDSATLTVLAKQGKPEAQFQLSRRLKIGLRGVKKDPQIAFLWLIEAAKNGHVIAQARIGRDYATGWGVEKDPKKSLYWLEQAAQNGHASSQFLVFEKYWYGIGTAKNPERAKFWAEKAYAQKDRLSVSMRNQLLRKYVFE